MVYEVLRFVCAILISVIAAAVMTDLLTKNGTFRRAKKRVENTKTQNLKDFNEEP